LHKIAFSVQKKFVQLYISIAIAAADSIGYRAHARYRSNLGMNVFKAVEFGLQNRVEL